MDEATPKLAIPPELRPAVAAAAKNLARHLYGPEGPPWGTRFDDLEEMAVQVARLLGSEILSHALKEQAARPVPEASDACPACAGALDGAGAEARSVHTRTGLAEWQEPSRFCARRRRAFFPPEQGAGHRPHRE
jgi:hypothetical protein